MSWESREAWPWLIVVGEAWMVGGLYEGEVTVTVGCSPSIGMVTPPP